MPKHQWRVRLRGALTDEQRDEVPHVIAQKIGMSHNTVRRYLENDEVVISQLSPVVSVLADYFGVNVFNVVDVVIEGQDDDEDEPQGQIKTAQLA